MEGGPTRPLTVPHMLAESRGSCVSLSRVIAYYTDRAQVPSTKSEKRWFGPPRNREFTSSCLPPLRS